MRLFPLGIYTVAVTYVLLLMALSIYLHVNGEVRRDSCQISISVWLAAILFVWAALETLTVFI